MVLLNESDDPRYRPRGRNDLEMVPSSNTDLRVATVITNYPGAELNF
jgi:hypothetical protein